MVEEPPHSRIFILHSRETKEEDIENAFKKFGQIEHTWRVKDKFTGENKGITYIKYSKFSEAAKAVEEMSGVTVDSKTRPLKVIIASSREKNEEFEREKFLRLFIMLPRDDSVSEEQLREYFSQYGKVEYASILKDKATNRNKGFAYIKYIRMDEAAVALEECDRKYKAVLARPRDNSKHDDTLYDRYDQDYYSGPASASVKSRRGPPPRDIRETNGSYYDPPSGSVRLAAFVSTKLTADQAFKLFDLLPGFIYAELFKQVSHRTNHLLVEYDSPKAAKYAMTKLNGFEYPVGEPLMLKPDYDEYNSRPVSKGMLTKRSREEPEYELSNKLAAVSSALAEATKLITTGPADSKSLIDNCSAKLPSIKPIVKDIDGEYRLFFVCKPQAPSLAILKDLFCRFGSMSSCYLLPGRNCGYVTYCAEEAANRARLTMHDQTLFGNIVKIVEADPPIAPSTKRFRYE